MRSPDVDVDAYIKITTGLLGVAYPILFQVVSKLDDKYGSVNIVGLLDSENEKKWFKWLLIIDLVAVFVWSLKIPPLAPLEGNYIVDNSGVILVVLTTTLLVIAFFLFVEKILIYYTPAKFINYLKKKHGSEKNVHSIKYFQAISDVFLHYVQKQNHTLTLTFLEFFTLAFFNKRQNASDTPVEYPNEYYILIRKTIEELAVQKNKRNYAVESFTVGGLWLLGDFGASKISKATYTCLWSNLVLSLEYEKDSFILHHWKTAHQYMWVQLPPLQREYNDKYELSNEDLIVQREQERKAFLEFHYALGGLLLYKNRYSCIGKIFKYTTSKPPRYELLPETMDEILCVYNEFADPYDLRDPWLAAKYGFPGQDAIESSATVKRFVKEYLSILFLRQYSLHQYYVHTDPLSFSAIPEQQSKRLHWLETIDYLKNIVSNSLKNLELMKELKLDFITEKWCIENKKLYPLEFIDKLKGELKAKYEEGQIIQPLSQEKVRNVFKIATEILEPTILLYKKFNVFSALKEYNSWFISGRRITLTKDAFSEDPIVSHLNYDTILPRGIIECINHDIAATFLFNRSKNYLLKKEDIFLAIEKIVGTNDDYIIVTFGVELTKYLSELKVRGFSLEKYKNIPIINLNGSRNLSQSFFILKKDDIPNIQTSELDEELIKEYSLKKISDECHIYASVLDLNKVDENIIKVNSDGKSADEIKKSVLYSIMFSLEVKWNKKVELIHILEYSEYGEKGLPNSLDDVA